MKPLPQDPDSSLREFTFKTVVSAPSLITKKRASSWREAISTWAPSWVQNLNMGRHVQILIELKLEFESSMEFRFYSIRFGLTYPHCRSGLGWVNIGPTHNPPQLSCTCSLGPLISTIPSSNCQTLSQKFIGEWSGNVNAAIRPMPGGPQDILNNTCDSRNKVSVANGYALKSQLSVKLSHPFISIQKPTLRRPI